MSIQFDWSQMDAKLAAKCVDQLNSMLGDLLNKYLTAEVTQGGLFDITQLEIVALDLGSTAPELALLEFEDAGFTDEQHFLTYVSAARERIAQHELNKQQRLRARQERLESILRGNGSDMPISASQQLLLLPHTQHRMGQSSLDSMDDSLSTYSLGAQSTVSAASSVVSFMPLGRFDALAMARAKMQRKTAAAKQTTATGTTATATAPAVGPAAALRQFGIVTEHVQRHSRTKKHKMNALDALETVANAETESPVSERGYSVYDFAPAATSAELSGVPHAVGAKAAAQRAQMRSQACRIRSFDAEGRPLTRRHTKCTHTTTDAQAQHVFLDEDEAPLATDDELDLLEELEEKRKQTASALPLTPLLQNAGVPLTLDLNELLGGRGLRLKTHFGYDGNASISIEFEVAINVPTPAFVSLPVSVTLSHLQFSGDLVVIYQNDNAYIYFERPRRAPYSPIKDFALTVKIGSDEFEGGKVLVDKGVIETFVHEQINKAMSQFAVFPQIITVPGVTKDLLAKAIAKPATESTNSAAAE